MYRFTGTDSVYHGKQSREGLIGSILWRNPPYGAGNAEVVYFHPTSWPVRPEGPVCAITRRDQLEAV